MDGVAKCEVFGLSDGQILVLKASTAAPGVFFSCGMALVVAATRGELFPNGFVSIALWSLPVLLMSILLPFIAPWCSRQRAVRLDGGALILKTPQGKKCMLLKDVTSVIYYLDGYGHGIAMSLAGDRGRMRLVGFQDMERLHDLVISSPDFHGKTKTRIIRARAWVLLSLPSWGLIVAGALIGFGVVAGVVLRGESAVLAVLLYVYILVMSTAIVYAWLAKDKWALVFTFFILLQACLVLGSGLYGLQLLVKLTG